MKVAPTLVVLAILAPFADVLADEPPNFRRTQVYVQPTVSVRHFLGALSDRSSWGIGMGMTQGAQFGYVGVNVTIDTDYFLSSQSPPPFNRGFQISGVEVSTRFVYPFGDFRPFGELGFRRIGFISNALVSDTGSSLSHHALSSSWGLRLLQLSPFYVELSSNIDWVFDLKETALFGFGLALGVRSIL